MNNYHRVNGISCVKLKQTRIDQGFTASRVQIGTGIDIQRIYSYESGKLVPNLKTLMKLINYYGVRLEDVLA